MSLSLSLWWDFVWLESVQVLSMLSQSLCIHISIGPIVSGRWCFLEVIHHLWLFRSFCPLFWSFEGRGLVKIPDLRLSFTFCTFCSNRFLYKLPSTSRRNVSDEGWAMHWYLGVIMCPLPDLSGLVAGWHHPSVFGTTFLHMALLSSAIGGCVLSLCDWMVFHCVIVSLGLSTLRFALPPNPHYL